MKVLRPGTVCLTFWVSSSEISVTFDLKKGDDTEEAVNSFLLVKKLPCELSDDLVHLCNKSLIDSYHHCDGSIDVFDTKAAAVNIQQWAEALNSSHYSPTTQKSEDKGSGIASSDMQFASEFNEVVNRDHKTSEILVIIQEKYARAVSAVRSGRKHALTRMQSKHAVEAETCTMLNNGDALATLVSKQVQDIEALEQQWDKEIRLLKQQQRKDYRAFLTTAFQSLSDDKTDDPVAASSPPSSVSVQPKDEVDWLECDEDLPRPLPMDLPSESFNVALGSQRQFHLTINVQVAGVPGYCQFSPVPEIRIAQRSEVALFLYSEQLHGVLVPGWPSDDGAAVMPNASFAALADASAEFHFDSLFAQLDSALDEHFKNVAAEGRGSDEPFIQPGDIFITKHSNIRSAQTAFHLMMDRKTDNVLQGILGGCVRTRVTDGLRRCIMAALQYDLTCFALPSLLTDSPPPFSQSDYGENLALILKRVEFVAKTVRATLTESATTRHHLQKLNFLVPLAVAPMFRQISDLINSIFQSA